MPRSMQCVRLAVLCYGKPVLLETLYWRDVKKLCDDVEEGKRICTPVYVTVFMKAAARSKIA
jgi:hypothetical protein